MTQRNKVRVHNNKVIVHNNEVTTGCGGVPENPCGGDCSTTAQPSATVSGGSGADCSLTSDCVVDGVYPFLTFSSISDNDCAWIWQLGANCSVAVEWRAADGYVVEVVAGVVSGGGDARLIGAPLSCVGGIITGTAVCPPRPPLDGGSDGCGETITVVFG